MGSAAALVLWVGGPNNFLAEAIFFENSVRERERERERERFPLGVYKERNYLGDNIDYIRGSFR